MALALGLDVGTQGAKGLVIDAQSGPSGGTVVARAARDYDLLEGLPAGAAEQHPSTWVDAVRAVAEELMAGLDPHAVAVMVLIVVALALFTRDWIPLETTSLFILITLVVGFEIFP